MLQTPDAGVEGGHRLRAARGRALLQQIIVEGRQRLQHRREHRRHKGHCQTGPEPAGPGGGVAGAERATRTAASIPQPEAQRLLGPPAWQRGSAPREVEAVLEGERDATVFPMDLAELHGLVTQGRYEFSAHAQRERLADDLDVIEIEQAVLNGEILEQYPRDPRGESCLVLGFSGARPIHVVLGWASRVEPERTTLRVITVYVPQPPKWSDARTRGGKQ